MVAWQHRNAKGDLSVAESAVEKVSDHGAHFGGSGSPGTGDVEYTHFVLLDECLQEIGGRFLVFTGHDENGFAYLSSMLNGQKSASRWKNG